MGKNLIGNSLLFGLLLVACFTQAFAQSSGTDYRLPRPARSVAEILLLPGTQAPAGQAPAAGETSDTSDLTLTVLEGEDGINIVKTKTVVKPVVEVRDRNKLPVAGIPVTFTLPSVGSGGLFANGSKIITVLTDSAGRATVTGMRPLGTGQFKINVSISSRGRTTSREITQTNYATMAAAQAAGAATTGIAASHGLSGLAIGAIVAGVAAVAVVVAEVAISGKSNSPSASAVSGTIGLGGSPVFGPH
jgi:hypothetical protein